MVIKRKTVTYNIRRVADEIERSLSLDHLRVGDDMNDAIWEKTQHVWISVSLSTRFDMKRLRDTL